MKLAKKAILGGKLIWILLFIYLGYVSYDAGGEASLGYGLIGLVLTFPSSLLFIYLIRAIDALFHVPQVSDHMGHLIVNVFFFAVGYFQWFILLPWFIRMILRLRQRIT